MINHPKTKEELLKELEELKLENESLKTLYEQDIIERKKSEEAFQTVSNTHRSIQRRN
jgi:hypothetical protein